MERTTNQKKAILDYLKSVHTHPTAEEIYEAAKKKLPRISRGTVYRNLNAMKEKGEILEILFSDVKRFDALTTNHHHFVCRNCNRVYDIEMKIPIKNKRIKNIGTVETFKVYFYGQCHKCPK